MKLYILSGLIKDFDQYKTASLEFLRKNFKNYRRVVFDNISPKNQPFDLDFDSCVNFILDSKDDIDKTTIAAKTYDGESWAGNDILFPFSFKMPPLLPWGTKQFLDYREWRDNLEYTCESEFWNDTVNLQRYKPFSDINIFDDRIFGEDELDIYKEKTNFLFIKEVWFDYIKSLLQLYFPQFSFRQEFSSKSIHRYLTEIDRDTWFGFEYELSEVRYELKKGTPSLPTYFNLILIKPPFDKTEKTENYYLKQHPSILSLGILGSPFFYYPCYPLLGYSAVDVHKRFEAGKPYMWKFVKSGSRDYQLVHPVEYGESMKKHAFFYMDLLAATSADYLAYLQNILVS